MSKLIHTYFSVETCTQVHVFLSFLWQAPCGRCKQASFKEARDLLISGCTLRLTQIPLNFVEILSFLFIKKKNNSLLLCSICCLLLKTEIMKITAQECITVMKNSSFFTNNFNYHERKGKIGVKCMYLQIDLPTIYKIFYCGCNYLSII